jgi:hypothetical protein
MADQTLEQRLHAAKDNAVLQAQIWAAEARGQRATVLEILRYFGLPEHDWEALRLIREKLEGTAAPGVTPSPAPRIEALARAYGQACHDAKSGEAMDAALRALLDASGVDLPVGAKAK